MPYQGTVCRNEFLGGGGAPQIGLKPDKQRCCASSLAGLFFYGTRRQTPRCKVVQGRLTCNGFSAKHAESLKLVPLSLGFFEENQIADITGKHNIGV